MMAASQQITSTKAVQGNETILVMVSVFSKGSYHNYVQLQDDASTWRWRDWDDKKRISEALHKMFMNSSCWLVFSKLEIVVYNVHFRVIQPVLLVTTVLLFFPLNN